MTGGLTFHVGMYAWARQDWSAFVTTSIVLYGFEGYCELCRYITFYFPTARAGKMPGASCSKYS